MAGDSAGDMTGAWDCGRPPHFICIGPGNSATTWLADHLKLQRDMWLPPAQEASYLKSLLRPGTHGLDLDLRWDLWSVVKRLISNRSILPWRDVEFYRQARLLSAKTSNKPDLQGYERLFEPAHGKLTGDIAPIYASFSTEQIRNLLPAFEGRKIFMIARDPVQRFWSAMSRHRSYRTFGDVDYSSLETARRLFSDPERSLQHFPTRIFDRWEEALGPGRLKVFYFDDIATRPREAFAAILEYLGSDPSQHLPLVPISHNRKGRFPAVEPPAEVRNWVKQAFEDELARCSERFGEYGQRWREQNRVAGDGAGKDSTQEKSGWRPGPPLPNLRTCTRCIMDETARDITFDDEGVCNYCTGFLAKKAKHLAPNETERQRRLDSLVAMVRKSGRGKRYDCIVGLSGGVDSSWSLVKAVELGLRPLAVHMDSGWNSELAQNNIANLVRTLGVDLHTHVIEWPEIRGLMEAFFASDVIDVEVLYDNAMLAVNYQQAARHGLKYILAGTNIATEGIDIPKGWNWYKSDKRNIVGISRAFGGPRLKTFPAISTLSMARYVIANRIRWISFLDYLDYKKLDALEVLKRDFGYKPYPHKHYESVFTRFYQGYLQPYKFGVDKRKPHLSSLIMNGEMSREDALRQAQGIAYPSDKEMEADRLYFIKKMGWSEEKFEDYMRRPEKPHDAYPSEAALYRRALGLYRRLGLKLGRLSW